MLTRTAEKNDLIQQTLKMLKKNLIFTKKNQNNTTFTSSLCNSR